MIDLTVAVHLPYRTNCQLGNGATAPGDKTGSFEGTEDMTARVFISYTHDSPAHRATVLEIATRLRSDGVDARLDRWVSGTPPEGWPAWMEQELSKADFVLVVCSETYYSRYTGQGSSAQGRGGRWEANLIRDGLYADRGSLLRYVPVLLPSISENTIPDALRYSVTHFRIPTEYESLFRYLTDQPEEVMPELGALRDLAKDPAIEIDARLKAKLPLGVHLIGQAADRIGDGAGRHALIDAAEAYNRVCRFPGRSPTLLASCANTLKQTLARYE
jgi:hypothetical protein